MLAHGSATFPRLLWVASQPQAVTEAQAPTSQSILLLTFSAIAVFVVVRLKRKQLLSLRYSLGWLTVAGLAIASALGAPLISPISERLGLTPTGFIFGVATAVLLGVSLQLSVSVSLLQHQVRDLVQALALRDVDHL